MELPPRAERAVLHDGFFRHSARWKLSWWSEPCNPDVTFDGSGFVSIRSWLEQVHFGEVLQTGRLCIGKGPPVRPFLVLARALGRRYRVCVIGRVVVVWILGLWAWAVTVP